MNGFFKNRQSWKTVVFVWLSIFGLVTGVQLVMSNLDNRSKASKLLEASCGSSNGLELDSRPVGGLCDQGQVVWVDLLANDGDYNWVCVSDGGGYKVECSSFLKN